MDVMGRAAFGELFSFDEAFCDRAAECGHRSFVIMAGAFDGTAVTAERLSHQDITGVGYGICAFYPEGPDDSRRFLEARFKEAELAANERRANADPYVKLAYTAVDAYVSGRGKIYVPDGLPDEMLQRRAGTFVSIHEHGALRGCIGTIGPTRASIAEEIIGNAVSASTRDPRFPAITADELPWLEISVDVLGEAEDIDSKDMLDVKRYGVIVTSGLKRGLLLPDLDGVDTVDQQIDIAKQKAGIGRFEKYKLQRFEVIRHF
jgi:AmmeMemoRadiSam system protein A